jgi:hypothetical protein
MNHRHIALGFVIALVFLAPLAGCGSKKLPSKVSGVVKLDGAPLSVDGTKITSGAVSFHPVGEGAVATGTIDSSGRYTLDTGIKEGIKPGDYIATVVATAPPPDDKTPGQRVTPDKYGSKETSDKKVTVVAGNNDIPLELTTK